MLEHLGVALEPSDMSSSASFGGGRYEYGTFSTRTMFAQPLCMVDAGHWRLIRDILRFVRRAPMHQAHDGNIGDLIDILGLGNEFRDRFLLPISGAIWYTSTAEMMKFPAGAFERFFENHGLLSVRGQPQWLTVSGGSQHYVRAILNRLQNLTTPNPLIVTLNAETEPRHIHDEARFAHPQFDASALAAQSRLGDIQGRGGIYHAGAWTRYGFHEDGLLSARRVAQAMGVEWPLGPDPWSITGTDPNRVAT